MVAFIEQFNPIVQALIATLFTWGVTALGSGMIFIAKDISKNLLNGMLGFASGVMIAASYWSLLEPAIELSRGMSVPVWFPAVAGFLLGGLFSIVDKLLPHLLMGEACRKVKFSSAVFFITAMHFTAFLKGWRSGWRLSCCRGELPGVALGLAGVRIQNFPVWQFQPLCVEGWPAGKAFMGSFQAWLNPCGLIGVLATMMMRQICPMPAFAAGR